MVLDTSLYKVLSWSPIMLTTYMLMGLIRSEHCYFGIRIQKIVFYCFYRSKTNYIRLNNLNIKKILEQNFHSLSFISKRSFICSGSFVNFIVVAVFFLIVAIRSNIITVATHAVMQGKI